MNPKKKTDIRVLLVDDEETFLDMITDTLTPRGCHVTTANNAQAAIEKLDSVFFDVIVLDVRMPGMDGVTLLRRLAEERPTQQVVMLTGHGTVCMAVDAMKLGAFDFLLKPVEVDDLMRTIRQAAEHGRLKRRNIALQKELERTRGSIQIIGKSEGIRKVHEFIETAVSSDLPVLITGETGTGKELVAQSIHAQSPRSNHPLVVVDGSILREELLASELFGHEKGAFTGAVKKKAGLFEVADQGTLFLDEIGEITLPNQSSLLRVIDHGTFRPVGSVREVKTDVRIIAATNKDVAQAVVDGEFRNDLFYRLKGLTIHIPPLRDRKPDITILAEHFLKERKARTGSEVGLSEQARTALLSYTWPGNVRELRYVIELAAMLTADGDIAIHHLPEEVRSKKGPDITAKSATGTPEPIADFLEGKPTMSEFTDRCLRYYIKHLLKESGGNKSKVAKALGISSSTLYAKLQRLGLD